MKNVFWIFVLFFSLLSCKYFKSHPKVSLDQAVIINYLYHSSLFSDTFSRYLWKIPVDCRGIDVENQQIYFVFENHLNKDSILNLVAIDTSKVEFSPCKTGDCVFGGLQGNADGITAFRMPTYNLKFDTKTVFKCHLKKDTFNFSYKELFEEIYGGVAYNSTKNVDLQKYYHQTVMASNIGSFISKKGKDPIIKKLLHRIIKDDMTTEQKAQSCLDFVSTEIEYSFEDYWYQVEITKRAHEVLFSGEADCSGKTTLLASLLEEADVPYCLLYFNSHINVGLRGDYIKTNKYHVNIHDTTYFMAETTVPNFLIGLTTLSNPEILTNVLMYQIPQQSENIYDFNTHEALPLVKLE